MYRSRSRSAEISRTRILLCARISSVQHSPFESFKSTSARNSFRSTVRLEPSVLISAIFFLSSSSRSGSTDCVIDVVLAGRLYMNSVSVDKNYIFLLIYCRIRSLLVRRTCNVSIYMSSGDRPTTASHESEHEHSVSFGAASHGSEHRHSVSLGAASHESEHERSIYVSPISARRENENERSIYVSIGAARHESENERSIYVSLGAARHDSEHERANESEKENETANESEKENETANEQRFAELFKRGRSSDVLFYHEIKAEIRISGIPYMSNSVIARNVMKAFAIRPNRPSKSVKAGSVKLQGAGFRHLRLADAAARTVSSIQCTFTDHALAFEVLFRRGRSTDVMFFSEISCLLDDVGISMTTQQISEHIFKIYHLVPCKPSKFIVPVHASDASPEITKKKTQGRGFKYLRRRVEECSDAILSE